ncbi:MAG: energy-coupling factor ABC transporter ATP-binding protein [Planctomycetia bacterium]
MTRPPPPEPVLSLCDVTYRYPDGRVALDGVSFTVAPGETVALVGPNGAGKTTLLLHLDGILPERLPAAADARVQVAGLPVCAKNLTAVRRAVGLLFQDPDDQLFCATVLEDVAFGPLNQGAAPAAARAAALAALAAVGLPDLGDRPPHRLSFGERKRVGLAGVLACRPQLLVLDEPTANLDPRARRQFLRLTASLPQPKLIATHDLDLVVELCDRVLILDEGRLWADGPPRDVLTNAALLETHGLETPPLLRAERAERLLKEAADAERRRHEDAQDR